MAVSEPEKYAERMTRTIVAPNKAPIDGSSKNGDLVLLWDDICTA
jgi:hypothetical protein